MAKEKVFETKVKGYLHSIGAYYVKNWGGYFMKAGVADLTICYKGYYIALELKSEDGRPSKLQLYNKKLVERAGGISMILYPHQFEMFKDFIEKLKPINHTIYLDLEGIPV